MCRWDAAFTEMSQGLACRAMRVIYHEVTSVSSRSGVLVRIECVRKALHTLVLHHPCNYINYDWNPRTIKRQDVMNTEKIALTPDNNTLYIFPSWLQHSVEPNKNKNIVRKSISFNFVSLYI